MTRRRRNTNSTHTITEVFQTMPAIRKLLALSALITCALLGWGASQAMASNTRLEISNFNGADTDAGAFQEVGRLAINQSSGTLYVIDNRQGGSVVDKFNENGVAEDFSALGSSSLDGEDVTPATTLSLTEGEIAVDNSAAVTNGRIYVLNSFGSTYYAFATSGAFLYQVHVPTESCSLSVDTTGNVWIGTWKSDSIVEYNSAGTPTGTEYATHHEGCATAFDGLGNIYVAGNGNTHFAGGIDGKIDKYNSAGVFQATIDQAFNTDITVDPATNDVLGASPFNSEVNEYDSTGALVANFHQSGAYGIAVRGSTERAYVSNEVADTVHIFGPVVLLPDVTTGVASNVTPATATLNGTVDPGGASLTDCHFEYVGDVEFQSSGGWASPSVQSAPCVPASVPTSGATPVSADIERPGVEEGGSEAVHFRLVAGNVNGSKNGFDRVFGFGITDFDGRVLQANGDPATQAGSHPSEASTDFHINTLFTPAGQLTTSEAIKNVSVELPPGVVGNPQALPTCSISAFAQAGSGGCPRDSQVGVIRLSRVGYEPPFGGAETTLGVPDEIYAGLYNLKAPEGTTGLIGFSILDIFPNYVSVKVRSGGDYGLTFESVNAALAFDFNGFGFDVWGVPGEPVHDSLRGPCTEGINGYPVPGCTAAYEGQPAAFLTLPTSCAGPQTTDLTVETWEGDVDHSSFISHDNGEPPVEIGADGCNTLDFSPTLEARPTTNVADAPTGLSVDLQMPQSKIAEPGSTAEAHLRKAVVNLPEGLVINPAGGNGLAGCSPDDVGLTSAPGVTPVTFTPDPAQCPDPSKLGTAEVDTPLLDHPLPGALYLATPHENPFDSLLAVYLTIYDAKSGTVVKLPGKIEADPSTGRLTAIFDENPQLPFEHLKLNITGGATAPLRTPSVCGNYNTTSSLTPWSAPDSGPPDTPEDSYSILTGPNGGDCANSDAARPNTPAFDAGTIAPVAGAHSPLVVSLRREDGSQQFASVTLSPPPGLIGKLAGIPYCSDAALQAAAAKTGAQEKANPSCPAASELGNVTAGAGAGPAPYYAPGKAYLTGPYKGAPIGLAVVIPAVAGPFDLGTVVVRAALFVDPKTAQITAVSDTIPSILEGIPLDVRTIQIRLDRPDFTINPTSCNKMSFGGQLTSTLGQSALLTNQFQVGECGNLGFAPQLSLSLTGGTKRRGHPALTAVLTTRPGDANLASLAVTLPPTELLDNAHIGTVCTRVQFTASNCPADSLYGSASVSTPLLDYELTGPVYLRSNPEHKLPDLVPDLRGPASQPIKLEAAGKTDTVKGGLRNSFEYIPDAPFSRVTLTLPGGSRGLIQNSTDLCKKTQKATVNYVAQNGLTLEQRPVLKVKCPKGKKHKKHHRHSHKRRGGHRASR
jgi:hypothetical protein